MVNFDAGRLPEEPRVFLPCFPAEAVGDARQQRGSRGGMEQAWESSLVSENVCAEVLGWMGGERGEAMSLRQPGQAACVSWDTRCCTTGLCEGAKIQNFRSANYC